MSLFIRADAEDFEIMFQQIPGFLRNSSGRFVTAVRPLVTGLPWQYAATAVGALVPFHLTQSSPEAKAMPQSHVPGRGAGAVPQLAHQGHSMLQLVTFMGSFGDSSSTHKRCPASSHLVT